MAPSVVDNTAVMNRCASETLIRARAQRHLCSSIISDFGHDHFSRAITVFMLAIMKCTSETERVLEEVFNVNLRK